MQASRGIFRAIAFGAATVAARNGVPDHQIPTLGRWSSNAYQLYIRTPSEVLARLSLQLAYGRLGKVIGREVLGLVLEEGGSMGNFHGPSCPKHLCGGGPWLGYHGYLLVMSAGASA